MVRAVVHPDAELVFDTSKPDGTPRKVLDVSRLRGLGWAPKISLQQGIEATYAWFLEQSRTSCAGASLQRCRSRWCRHRNRFAKRRSRNSIGTLGALYAGDGSTIFYERASLNEQTILSMFDLRQPRQPPGTKGVALDVPEPGVPEHLDDQVGSRLPKMLVSPEHPRSESGTTGPVHRVGRRCGRG